MNTRKSERSFGEVLFFDGQQWRYGLGVWGRLLIWSVQLNIPENLEEVARIFR